MRVPGCIAIGAAVVALVVGGCQPSPESSKTVEGAGVAPSPPTSSPPPPTPSTEAADAPATGLTVASITDGDTLRLTDGRSVRLAQVDAPETNECFGSEATAALARHAAAGTQVELHRPPSGPATDRYGRTLADIRVDGASVNEALVRDGAAEWYEQFADEDADLAARLSAAEQAARAEGRGLWSACRGSSASARSPGGGVSTTVTTEPPAAPPAAATGSAACHPGYPDECLPASPDLDCPDIGHLVRVDQSRGDPHRLDADGDGWGCETYR